MTWKWRGSPLPAQLGVTRAATPDDDDDDVKVQRRRLLHLCGPQPRRAPCALSRDDDDVAASGAPLLYRRGCSGRGCKPQNITHQRERVQTVRNPNMRKTMTWQWRGSLRQRKPRPLHSGVLLFSDAWYCVNGDIDSVDGMVKPYGST
ncbi:hypothetical protein EDB83DRAFT_2313900 [Lactarius deliciosus]|nr:hypothetical protein EDB83DRAFT_2313900 [Lactarius deliciosus]